MERGEAKSLAAKGFTDPTHGSFGTAPDTLNRPPLPSATTRD
jgi:hypothetical protein